MKYDDDHDDEHEFSYWDDDFIKIAFYISGFLS
jgi:hypothetical protein